MEAVALPLMLTWSATSVCVCSTTRERIVWDDWLGQHSQHCGAIHTQPWWWYGHELLHRYQNISFCCLIYKWSIIIKLISSGIGDFVCAEISMIHAFMTEPSCVLYLNCNLVVVDLCKHAPLSSIQLLSTGIGLGSEILVIVDQVACTILLNIAMYAEPGYRSTTAKSQLNNIQHGCNLKTLWK